MNSKTYLELRLILGDQLNQTHSWFAESNPRMLYVMMEIRPESEYVKHHIQKITGFFFAMRNFAGWLKNQGHRVRYFHINDPDNRQSFRENLKQLVAEHAVSSGRFLEPDEYRLDILLTGVFSELFPSWEKQETEHFYTSRNELKDFFKGRKTYLMESFYRHMRKKHRVLMDPSGQPEGDQWNFDRENRKNLPAEQPLPDSLLKPIKVERVFEDVQQAALPNFGGLDPGAFHWPVTRKSALEILAAFIEQRLQKFGTYQDAMTTRSWQLFHSMLSFALNIKLIRPDEVVQAVEAAWRGDPERFGIQQVEGYIRQVIGWREYMRGIYWAQMPAYEQLNYFDHQKRLPGFFWTGRTRMNCMKQTLDQSLKHAYAHHIQRLMVTGNFALLAGIDPDEVDRWYLGVYIDAVQWVEITNTRGMSQFADGGIVGTKPYVSSAAYIDRMSDYCSGCTYDPKGKVGEHACPFNSLYWHFHVRNRSLLEKNPRIGMIYRTWDRMNPGKKEALLEQAEKFLEDIESL